MKKLMLGVLLAVMMSGPGMALTEDSTRDYYSSPVIGGGMNLFRAQAVHIRDASGARWVIRLRTAQILLSSTLDTLSINDAKRLINQGQLFLAIKDISKTSDADVHERRTGITENLDLVYRYERITNSEDFILVLAGRDFNEAGFVVNREDFAKLLKALEIALSKVKAE